MVFVVGVMFGVTAFLDKLLEKRSLNPDDLLIPVVTSVTDVLMLGLVALAVVTIFS
jgi:cation transporter-like permease